MSYDSQDKPLLRGFLKKYLCNRFLSREFWVWVSIL